MWQDIKFAARMLAKAPGFTAVAVLTLALGIGANTAMFSVLDGVLLAPLPYSQPDRLVTIWLNNFTLKYATDLSYPDFRDWQRNARSFQQMAALTWQGYDLIRPGTPEHLLGKQISSGFFSMLGAKMALGREFTPNEDQQGGAPTVVISDRLWRNRFARSSQAVGKSVTLDGVRYTIVGVLTPGFRFGSEDADVYTPIGQEDSADLNDRTVHNVECVARLKPDVNIGQAQAEISAIQENIDKLHPDTEQGLGTEIMPLKQQLVGDVRGTLMLLLGAVGVVLLIACANVANLLLARSTARTREFAIRSALGASRGRIVRQLVTENVLLSLVGGGIGLLLAKWGLDAVLADVPATLPRSENIGVNVSVLVFTLVISLAVGILFGLAPACKSSRTDLQASLKKGGRGSTSAHHRAQSSVVIAQMALTLVLLAGAGLLFRTIRHLWTVNPGFDPQHVITFQVGLSASSMKSGLSVRTAYQQLLERIRQIPGVRAADLTTMVPLSGQASQVPFWIGSQKPASVAEAPRVLGFITGPDYLHAMGIPLIRGRFISQEDTINLPPVVVIDTVLAHTYFPHSDPVGQTITFPQVNVPYRIIGVVGHVKQYGLGKQGSRWPQNEAYVAFYQEPERWMPTIDTQTTLVVRTSLDVASLMPAIKKAVYGMGDDQTVYGAQTMQAIVSDSMSSQRFPMILLGTFAGLALLLASIGIYGVISYSVTQRVHEIGIRMALGAEKRDVFRMIIGQGLRLALAGLAIGMVAALILTRLLSSFSDLLYGVRAGDPATFVGVAVLLAIVALVACYVPARRAMRIEPMEALRYE